MVDGVSVFSHQCFPQWHSTIQEDISSILLCVRLIGFTYTCYNIGNPYEEVNAETIANKIGKVTNQNLNLAKKVPYPENYPNDEPKRRCPSIKNFSSEFKFKPKIKLNTGLKMFLNYAKKNF